MSLNEALSNEVLENSLPLWSDEPDLLTRFNTYFDTETANTASLIENAHALRYQVYCLEKKFEKPNQLLDGLEMDEFDSHALHGLLRYRPTNEVIGTVRLILPVKDQPAESFPVQQLVRGNDQNAFELLPIEKTVEVSRFAISKRFRRHYRDELRLLGFSNLKMEGQTAWRRNLLCLGLLQILLRQSVERGVIYWVAVMEPKMLRMLAAIGIRYTPVGGLVVHHGLRQPCYCDVQKMLKILRCEYPEYWNVITNGGELAF
jgi:N-acyl amino acid synthase of PEP-CTERM/exosortase system